MTHDHLISLWDTTGMRERSFKWLVIIIAGIVLGIITPYDSDNLPDPFLRYSYWMISSLFAMLVSKPVARILLSYLRKRDIKPLYSFLVYCCAVAIPVFGFVIMLDLMLFATFISDAPPLTSATLIAFMQQTPNYPDSAVAGFLVWYLQVLVLVLLIFGAMTLLYEKRRSADVPINEEIVPPGTVFLERLPHTMNRKISCLAMEDHYIRVYAGQESCLILMRMADAVHELAGYGGMQVHRSWWVAFDAVEHRDREGRRHFLVLKDGRKVPISQTYLSAVKEKGL